MIIILKKNKEYSAEKIIVLFITSYEPLLFLYVFESKSFLTPLPIQIVEELLMNEFCLLFERESRSLASNILYLSAQESYYHDS